MLAISHLELPQKPRLRVRIALVYAMLVLLCGVALCAAAGSTAVDGLIAKRYASTAEQLRAQGNFAFFLVLGLVLSSLGGILLALGQERFRPKLRSGYWHQVKFTFEAYAGLMWACWWNTISCGGLLVVLLHGWPGVFPLSGCCLMGCIIARVAIKRWRFRQRLAGFAIRWKQPFVIGESCEVELRNELRECHPGMEVVFKQSSCNSDIWHRQGAYIKELQVVRCNEHCAEVSRAGIDCVFTLSVPRWLPGSGESEVVESEWSLQVRCPSRFGRLSSTLRLHVEAAR